MTCDPIYEDPEPVDKTFPASLAPVTFQSHGSRLIGNILICRGYGPHPTVILLHGFPGNEKNIDLAQIFRRAGWNVLIFHYRGSWGSEGVFSFQNVLEDVLAAIDFLQSDHVYERYRIDPEKIVLVGHSMGGFAALISAAEDKRIKAVASIAAFNFGLLGKRVEENEELFEFTIDFFETCLPPLRGTDTEILIDEVIKNREAWDLHDHAGMLAEKPVLLIGGSRDEISRTDSHYQPLLQAFIEKKATSLTHVTLDADHSFSDKRIALARALLLWLGRQFQDFGHL